MMWVGVLMVLAVLAWGTWCCYWERTLPDQKLLWVILVCALALMADWPGQVFVLLFQELAARH